MTNPLLEFDSPRAFQNADSSTFRASALTKLGPDLVASREPANPSPGELSFLVLGLNPGGPVLGGYYTIAQTDAAIAAALTNYTTTAVTIAAYNAAIALAVSAYLPLTDVSVTSTADKVSKRNGDRELLASNFRPEDGCGLRGVSDTASVVMMTNASVKGVEVKGTSPSGGVKLAFYGGTPILKPAVNAADADQGVAVRTALEALGAISVTPGTPPKGPIRPRLEKLASDINTNSATYADVLTVSYTSAKSELLLDASFMFESDDYDAVLFRVTVDGVVQQTAAFRTQTDIPSHGAFTLLASGVSPGAHTIALQWANSGTGTTIYMYGVTNGAFGPHVTTLRVAESDSYS